MTTRTLLPTASGGDTRRVLVALLARRRRLTIAATLVLAASTVVSLLVPPLLGAVADVVSDGGRTGEVDRLVIALVAVFATRSVLGGSAHALVARLGQHTLADLREEVMERVLGLSQATVEDAGVGDLLARVGDDVDAVSEAAREAIPILVGAVLTIGFTIVGLAWLDWRLALAGFAAVPVQYLATRRHLRRSRPLYAAERTAGSERTQQLAESVSAADTVRAFGLGSRHRRLVADTSAAALDRSLAAGWAGSRYFVFLNAAEAIGLGTTLLVGFLTVRADVVSVGEATAAALYFHGLFNPIGFLLTLLDTAQDAGAALARLVGVTTMPDRPDPNGGDPSDGSIDLRGITFGYDPTRPVISGLDLRIGSGERVAIVGSSGAGKTTIGRLVAGIHQPQHGTVTIGGRPVGTLAGSVVGLISQEVHVFAGTVADDLRLVAPGADDGELLAALRQVGADGWVDALPDGLETVVGDGGHQLSAAEAQHLALARLALSDATVVVLDEATADAGSRGARILEVGAEAAIADRTAIVIAHRLTQAARADRIVVVEHGTVVEEGTHSQLLATGGRYAELWKAWASRRPASRTGGR